MQTGHVSGQLLCVDVLWPPFPLLMVQWNTSTLLGYSLPCAGTRYRTWLLNDTVFFNCARTHFHALQKAAQRESWQRYVYTLTEDTPITSVWAKFKSIEGRCSGMHRPVLKHNNTLHTDPRNVANIFAYNLSDISQGLQSPQFFADKIKRLVLSCFISRQWRQWLQCPFYKLWAYRSPSMVLQYCSR